MSMEGSPSSQPVLAAPTTSDGASDATSVNSLQAKGSRGLRCRRTRKSKSQSGHVLFLQLRNQEVSAL
jgi:hypothetical protein